MTVFLGMTVLLVLSLFFSLLEVVHYVSIKKETGMLIDIGMESMMADYCRPMWDEYGVLGIDGGYGGSALNLSKTKERLLGYIGDNVMLSEEATSGHHLFVAADDCEIPTYGLLTDQDGAPFMQECAKAALYGIPSDVYDGLIGRSEEIRAGDFDWQDNISESQDAYSEAVEERNEYLESLTEEELANFEYEEPEWTETALTKEEAASVGNPMSMVAEWKNKSILEQVLPKEAVSSAALSVEQPVSERSLAQGNASVPSVSMMDRLRYQYYLMDRFASYKNPKKKNRDAV